LRVASRAELAIAHQVEQSDLEVFQQRFRQALLEWPGTFQHMVTLGRDVPINLANWRSVQSPFRIRNVPKLIRRPCGQESKTKQCAMDKIRDSSPCSTIMHVVLRFGFERRPGRDVNSLPFVFRAYYQRFRTWAAKEKYISWFSLEPLPGRDRKKTWSLKDEWYRADFVLVSRRNLDDDGTWMKLSTKSSNSTVCWGPIGFLVAVASKIDQRDFFHMCIESSKNWGERFGNWNPTHCSPWMSNLRRSTLRR
jgi:hypothetical protein